MSSGVYAITNIVTGSCYVGSAINIKQRWLSHKSSLATNRNPPPKLYRAWCKYGPEAFSFDVLLLCDKDNTLLYEQLAIDALKPRYNTRVLAKSNLGLRWGDAVNQKKGRPEQIFSVNGHTGSLRFLAKQLSSVTYETVRVRVKEGWSVEDALLSPATPRRENGNTVAALNKDRETHPCAKVFTVNGITGSIKQLAEKLASVPVRAVRSRLNRGWSLEKALLTPRSTVADRTRGLRSFKDESHPAATVLTVRGITGSIRMLCDHFDVDYAAVLKRLNKHGWEAERAFTTPVAARKRRGS